MKDQYFTDERDFFKWDFLDEVLERCKELRMVTNLIMLTPADDSGQGNRDQYECG